jgi:hypothetical protein
MGGKEKLHVACVPNMGWHVTTSQDLNLIPIGQIAVCQIEAFVCIVPDDAANLVSLPSLP